MIQNKSPELAASLSFLITGLGQIYIGEIGYGVGLFALFITLTLLYFPYSLIFSIPIWIYSIVNAYKNARELNNKLLIGGQTTSRAPSTLIPENKYSVSKNNLANDINSNKVILDKQKDTVYNKWLADQIGNIDNSKSKVNNINISYHNQDAYKSNSVKVADFIEQLSKYKKLYDNNVLTFTEYEINKKKVIKEIEIRGIYGKNEDFLIDILPLIKENSINDDELAEIKNIIL